MRCLLRNHLILCLLFLLTSSLATVAQNSSGTNPQATVTFRAEAHQVLLDVVVADHNGRFVAGVIPAHFPIREEAKPQKIVAFGMHAASATPSSPAPKIKLPPN